MSPNPYILLRNLVNPTRWFTSNAPSSQKSKGRIEHWEKPLPGYYEYVPARGWFLVAIDTDDGEKLDNPVPLTYCRILHRFMLKDDFESRKKWGVVKDEHGKAKKGFLFRMDDGVTWIYCWNEFGEFDMSERRIPYCIDVDTRKFRAMSVAERQSVSRESSEETIHASSMVQSGAGATPSTRSIVESGARTPYPARSSLPSTQPSTRPSTRPGSSDGSALQHTLTRSSATTPPSLVELQLPKLDAPELNRKLRSLTER